MRSHINDFENVVTICTKVTAQNQGSYGFEHIRKAFDRDVKPFVKTLKVYFYMFDQGLHKEITDMKEVFTQIETEVAKCFAERKTYEIKEKELLLENDRLLELLISQDLVHTAMNSLAKIIDYQSMEKSFLDEYSECVELKADLSKKNEMVEKVVYDELSKRCARMENRYISLEIKVQKSLLKEKDNSVSKLKDHIANLKGKSVSEGNKSDNISKVIASGQNFTIDGHMCPLTRLVSTTVVLPKKPLSSIVVKKTQTSSNTPGKYKDITNVGRSNRPMVPGLGLLQAHDETTLSAHQIY
ncbi:hypothetical protein Tco_1517593 [Tanacetum coccineum]